MGRGLALPDTGEQTGTRSLAVVREDPAEESVFEQIVDPHGEPVQSREDAAGTRQLHEKSASAPLSFRHDPASFRMNTAFFYYTINRG